MKPMPVLSQGPKQVSLLRGDLGAGLTLRRPRASPTDSCCDRSRGGSMAVGKNKRISKGKKGGKKKT